jgi:DNA-binding transcriptional LysR family regulator
MEWTDRIGRRIKLRDLHILLAVARSGSMGKAAAELAVSQPVVSKSIAELEHAVGLRLLDRGPQGVEPTAYGRALLAASAAAFDELRQGVKALEFLADPAAGELRIGCTEAGAAGFVPVVIDRLRQQHPRVVFHVTTADPVTLVERELRGRATELALGATPGPAPGADIGVEILFEDRLLVMAGPGSKWHRRRAIPPADLLGEPWILPPPGSKTWHEIVDAFRASGLEPPASHVASFSLPLCHHLLATGRYLAMLPVTMARLNGHLPFKPLDVRLRAVTRSIALMTLKNRTLSPLARLFVDCARELAKPLGGRAKAVERAR